MSTETSHLRWAVEAFPDLSFSAHRLIAEKLTKQMPRAQFVLIPISDATRGHGTHTMAALWKDHLVELLKQSESKP